MQKYNKNCIYANKKFKIYKSNCDRDFIGVKSGSSRGQIEGKSRSSRENIESATPPRGTTQRNILGNFFCKNTQSLVYFKKIYYFCSRKSEK